MSETLKKYETIKEHVYAMHTPDVLSETKRISKRMEFDVGTLRKLNNN